MIKSVSFNDISEIQVIDMHDSYSVETKMNDGQLLENQYLYQLIYLYFTSEDEFHGVLNGRLMKENQQIFINLLKKIINHLQDYVSYHLYNYKFKITKKKKKDIDKLRQLLDFIERL